MSTLAKIGIVIFLVLLFIFYQSIKTKYLTDVKNPTVFY